MRFEPPAGTACVACVLQPVIVFSIISLRGPATLQNNYDGQLASIGQLFDMLYVAVRYDIKSHEPCTC